MWQLRMHCNLRSPDETVLFRFNYDAVLSLQSLNLFIAVYSVFTADTLLYAVTLTFDHVTLTFDL